MDIFNSTNCIEWSVKTSILLNWLLIMAGQKLSYFMNVIQIHVIQDYFVNTVMLARIAFNKLKLLEMTTVCYLL